MWHPICPPSERVHWNASQVLLIHKGLQRLWRVLLVMGVIINRLAHCLKVLFQYRFLRMINSYGIPKPAENHKENGRQQENEQSNPGVAPLPVEPDDHVASHDEDCEQREN